MTYPPQQPEPNQPPYVPYGTDPYAEPGREGPFPPHQLPPGQPMSPTPYGPPPQVAYVVKAPSSTMAVTSMILGIVGLLVGCCSFGVPSILAVIFGHIGLKETAGGKREGHGMAVAGLIMGYIGVAPAIFFSVTWFIGAITSGMHPTPTPTP